MKLRLGDLNSKINVLDNKARKMFSSMCSKAPVSWERILVTTAQYDFFKFGRWYFNIERNIVNLLMNNDILVIFKLIHTINYRFQIINLILLVYVTINIFFILVYIFCIFLQIVLCKCKLYYMFSCIEYIFNYKLQLLLRNLTESLLAVHAVVQIFYR